MNSGLIEAFNKWIKYQMTESYTDWRPAFVHSY